MFTKGEKYTRNDIGLKYFPQSGRPKGGNWVTGYVSVNDELVIFMNVDVVGNAHREKLSHDYQNQVDRDNNEVVWFGKRDTHSGQPIFKKLINGNLRPQLFARWAKNDPFEYLGEGEYLSHKDYDKDLPGDPTEHSRAIQIRFSCHEYGFKNLSTSSMANTSEPSGEKSILPEAIPAEYLEKAIKRIDDHGISPHAESTTYDVVVGSKRYPPIAVVRIAYEEMTGRQFSGKIRGGRGTRAFKILTDAGMKPEPKYFESTSDNKELDERVNAIRERGEPLGDPPKGNKKPKKRTVSEGSAVERDPQVKHWILEKADGICELCLTRSPYRSKAKGNPWYLEVHHVIPLKAGGPDTVCNAVALCPNCHTRCHQSVEAIEATELLYKQVTRLTKE